MPMSKEEVELMERRLYNLGEKIYRKIKDNWISEQKLCEEFNINPREIEKALSTYGIDKLSITYPFMDMYTGKYYITRKDDRGKVYKLASLDDIKSLIDKEAEIHDKLLEFFNRHPDKYYTAEEVAGSTNLSVDEVKRVLYLMSLLIDYGNLKTIIIDEKTYFGR